MNWVNDVKSRIEEYKTKYPRDYTLNLNKLYVRKEKNRWRQLYKNLVEYLNEEEKYDQEEKVLWECPKSHPFNCAHKWYPDNDRPENALICAKDRNCLHRGEAVPCERGGGGEGCEPLCDEIHFSGVADDNTSVESFLRKPDDTLHDFVENGKFIIKYPVKDEPGGFRYYCTNLSEVGKLNDWLGFYQCWHGPVIRDKKKYEEYQDATKEFDGDLERAKAYFDSHQDNSLVIIRNKKNGKFYHNTPIDVKRFTLIDTTSVSGDPNVNTTKVFVKLPPHNLLVEKPYWMFGGPFPLGPRKFTLVDTERTVEALESIKFRRGETSALSADHCNEFKPTKVFKLVQTSNRIQEEIQSLKMVKTVTNQFSIPSPVQLETLTDEIFVRSDTQDEKGGEIAYIKEGASVATGNNTIVLKIIQADEIFAREKCKGTEAYSEYGCPALLYQKCVSPPEGIQNPADSNGPRVHLLATEIMSGTVATLLKFALSNNIKMKIVGKVLSAIVCLKRQGKRYINLSPENVYFRWASWFNRDDYFIDDRGVFSPFAEDPQCPKICQQMTTETMSWDHFNTTRRLGINKYKFFDFSDTSTEKNLGVIINHWYGYWRGQDHAPISLPRYIVNRVNDELKLVSVPDTIIKIQITPEHLTETTWTELPYATVVRGLDVTIAVPSGVCRCPPLRPEFIDSIKLEEWHLLWEMAVFTVTLYLPSDITDFLQISRTQYPIFRSPTPYQMFELNLVRLVDNINKQNFGDLPLENLKKVFTSHKDTQLFSRGTQGKRNYGQ